MVPARGSPVKGLKTVLIPDIPSDGVAPIVVPKKPSSSNPVKSAFLNWSC